MKEKDKKELRDLQKVLSVALADFYGGNAPKDPAIALTAVTQLLTGLASMYGISVPALADAMVASSLDDDATPRKAAGGDAVDLLPPIVPPGTFGDN
jgi:hypothetical protein